MTTSPISPIPMMQANRSPRPEDGLSRDARPAYLRNVHTCRGAAGGAPLGTGAWGPSRRSECAGGYFGCPDLFAF